MKDFTSLKRVIHELNSILSSRQKKESIIVFISMLLCSGLELLGVTAIYPFLDSMLDLESISAKWYARIFQGFFSGITNVQIVIMIGCIIILIYLVKNVVALGCAYLQYRFAARFGRELTTLMLESYLKRPYEFFVNTNSSVLIRSINGDTNSAYRVLLDLFQLIAEILTAIMIGVYLLFQDFFIAIAALFLAMVCFFVIVVGLKKRIKKAGIEQLEATTERYKYCYQAINGIKEISVMDRRDAFIRQYEESARKLEKVSLFNDFVNACPNRVLEGVCISGFLGIACVRLALGIDANTFIPVLGSFALGAFRILPSISKMATKINDIVFNQARLSICYENILEARKLDEDRLKNSKETEECNEKDTLYSFEGEIKLSNIEWKYKNSDHKVLDGLELTIKKGDSIALVGASGAGKSTLADIILGLYKPQRGIVAMDGVDIFTIPHSWAKTIGYVPQSVFLMDDTIKANIAFGLPYHDINDEKVWEALRKAQLYDFVKSLPDGLDTIVGERGLKLSGGQRQRIAIARALYEDPEILVLDEATSALDNDTEIAVMEAIDSLRGNKTLIIIAHRLSTIRNCSKAYEICEGKAILRDVGSLLLQDKNNSILND